MALTLPPRSISVYFFTLALPLLIGAGVAAMVLKLGLLGLGAVIALCLLPWFMRQPFRLYLWLLATWPVLSLYLHIPLPAGMPDLNYERVIVLLIVAFVLVPALVRRENAGVPTLNRWVWVYIAAQTLSYSRRQFWGGPSAPDVVILLNSVLVPITLYWLTKVFITSRARLKQVLYALIIAGVVVSVSGLYERTLDLRESPFPISTGTASGERYLDVPGGRAAGVAGNPAIYGALAGMGLLASLGCYAHIKQTRHKLLLAPAIALLSYSIFVSFTRSAWLAALAGIAIAQFSVKGLSSALIRLALLGLLAAALLVIAGIDLQLIDQQTLQNRVLQSQNVSGRIDRIVYAWEQFIKQPALGWGAGALDALTGRRFPQGGFNTSHSTYLTLLVDGGLVLFAGFMALIAHWGIQTVQIYRQSLAQSWERSAVGVIVGCMAIYLISGFALELKLFGYLNALFWIAGAALERLQTLVQDDQPDIWVVTHPQSRYVN